MSAALMPLPADIEEALQACERIIERDQSSIDDALDTLDGIESSSDDWDDLSTRRTLEELQASAKAARGSARQASDSLPPLSRPVGR